MQKVVTINLNGRAYQVDEPGYELLRSYLTRAESRLANNPDRAEILADFEQAIAEKCDRFVGTFKTVVSTAEMDQIVKEMGPVEGEGGSSAAADTTDPSRKRLYRIRDGALWAGVCTGLAAYVGIDVVIVRVVVVALTAATFGWGLLGYFILATVIPEAHTSDERAAAHGEAPFNAQEVIDAVKQQAEEIRNNPNIPGSREWKRQRRAAWRQRVAARRHWKRQWRARPEVPYWWGANIPPPTPPPLWAMFLIPIVSVISLALFAGLALAVVSLVNTGAIYGWVLPAKVPMWAAVLMLVAGFFVVTSPLRAMRQFSYSAWGRPGMMAAWDGLFGLAVTAGLLYLVLRHMPPVHDLGEFVHNVPNALKSLARDVSAWISQVVAAF